MVFVPPLRPDLEAVVSLTGRAYLATGLCRADFGEQPLDGFGATLAPGVLARLAGDGGEVGVLDATLVGRGVAGAGLPVRHDVEDHPRVRHARAIREDVHVYGDGRGLVTLARGLAGRTELSVASRFVELVQAERDRTGRVGGALDLGPGGVAEQSGGVHGEQVA